MQITQLLLTALSASSVALAAPVGSKSMMADVTEWTIENMKRVCNKDDTACKWTFGINTGEGDATPCTYIVKGDPASRANGGPSQCGDFTITSGWSGQFGEENGFTTLSVVDEENRLIIYPAYTDKQLEDGKVVKPDQSYAPASIP